VISPGHELLEIERVTSASDHYLVVDKTIEVDYAIRGDPRPRRPGLAHFGSRRADPESGELPPCESAAPCFDVVQKTEG
jgi:hypothetical protein